ncbi:hypothetical protein Tsubulata_047839 [Turnera subulata]|uniref:Uncharacterized protein n=1 Tax=Turnera subulata TaxID=218843 RepID=A0A9Q0FMX1_9ROSI|nr:hypothetical protein Tsubulata_047839 [Turnera subulata]
MDHFFEEIGGETGRLVNYNPMENADSQHICCFLQAVNVAVKILLAPGYASLEHDDPGARPVLPWLQEGGRDKNVSNTIADIFNSHNLACLSNTEIENTTRFKNRGKAWLDLLYAAACGYRQAMEVSPYVGLVKKLEDARANLQKFRAGGKLKTSSREEVHPGDFARIVFSPSSCKPIKHSSEVKVVLPLMA